MTQFVLFLKKVCPVSLQGCFYSGTEHQCCNHLWSDILLFAWTWKHELHVIVKGRCSSVCLQNYAQDVIIEQYISSSCVPFQNHFLAEYIIRDSKGPTYSAFHYIHLKYKTGAFFYNVAPKSSQNVCYQSNGSHLSIYIFSASNCILRFPQLRKIAWMHC